MSAGPDSQATISSLGCVLVLLFLVLASCVLPGLFMGAGPVGPREARVNLFVFAQATVSDNFRQSLYCCSFSVAVAGCSIFGSIAVEHAARQRFSSGHSRSRPPGIEHVVDMIQTVTLVRLHYGHPNRRLMWFPPCHASCRPGLRREADCIAPSSLSNLFR